MEETGDREKPLFMGVLGFGFDSLDKNDFLCSNVLRQLKGRAIAAKRTPGEVESALPLSPTDRHTIPHGSGCAQ